MKRSAAVILASQGTFVVFSGTPKYSKTENGQHGIPDLPLIDVPGGKGKKFKEFFEVVDDVTLAQQQQVRVITNSEHPRLIDLPDNISPGTRLYILPPGDSRSRASSVGSLYIKLQTLVRCLSNARRHRGLRRAVMLRSSTLIYVDACLEGSFQMDM